MYIEYTNTSKMQLSVHRANDKLIILDYCCCRVGHNKIFESIIIYGFVHVNAVTTVNSTEVLFKFKMWNLAAQCRQKTSIFHTKSAMCLHVLHWL